MKKTKIKPGSGDDIAGTYVYDKELGKVVKVSDRIPGVSSKKGRGSPKSSSGPCGGGPCGSGACGRTGGGFN